MRRSLTLVLVAGSVCASGCGVPAPVRRDVSATARRFGAAVRAGDGAAACREVAPETARELTGAHGVPCAEAILDESLTDGTSVRHTAVYGQQAMVRLDGDTVFLARFASGWRITAAGCEPQPHAPYHCAVEGG